jgi:hypothetical protein
MKQSQQQRAEELGVRPYFYYLGGTTTVCLLKKDNECVARGISICSPLDQFEKSTGRAKAFGRALKAFIKENTDCLILIDRLVRKYNGRYELEQLLKTHHTFLWKSSYLPTLTEYEERIIHNGTQVQNNNCRV